MQMQEMRSRSLKQLSHGELRRAWTAMALAQRPDILLLDEPTAFLDLAHQFELLDLLSELKSHGVTVVVSMHDLWMTAIYCERVIAMRDGRIIGNGPAEEVLTVDLIRDVFGVEVALSELPMAAGKRGALPYARRRAPDAAAARRFRTAATRGKSGAHTLSALSRRRRSVRSAPACAVERVTRLTTRECASAPRALSRRHHHDHDDPRTPT